jgi:hypothetical protein
MPKEEQEKQGWWCSLSLVLKDFGIYEEAKEAWLWLSFTEVMDNRGPQEVSKQYGINFENFRATQSPIEGILLGAFADCKDTLPGWLREAMIYIGLELLQSLKDRKERFKLLDEVAEICKIKKPLTIEEQNANMEHKEIEIVVLPADLTKTPMFCMQEWCKIHAPGAKGMISRDEFREGNWAMRRFNDDCPLDFHRIKDLPGVTFVHTTGFVASAECADGNVALEQYIPYAMT